MVILYWGLEYFMCRREGGELKYMILLKVLYIFFEKWLLGYYMNGLLWGVFFWICGKVDEGIVIGLDFL